MAACAATSPAIALVGAVAGAMAPPPPCLPPETPLGEAIAAMGAARASCVLAVDGDGRPCGMLTEQDVARRVVFRLPQDAPLAAATSTPVIACAAGEGLWRAVALLRAHRLRHLPVLDAAGRCIGLLHRAEALAAVSGRMLTHLDALSGDDAGVKRAQAGVAAALLDEGLAAGEVVALVNGINLDLHRRLLARALAEAPPPPVPFALLVMGSLGRGESLLAPDQDNGWILDDYPDAEHEAVDAWCRPVAERFNAALDAAGFVFCPGGVMARNPLWRKTRRQWAAQFEGWAQRRRGAGLLFADIFLDFRVAEGEPAWGEALRRAVAQVLAAQPAMLAALAAQNSRLTVGLTLFGGFADDEPGPGTRTDLKLHGLMPLVAAARLAALSAGVQATGTAERLASLAALGQLGANEAARLQAGFATLLDIVLRQQLADHAAGLPPGNLVDTAALPAPQREALRDALRAARRFAGATFAGFTGRLW
jgi:signal-transduction protein with cAMP-binding, CBS, and nucleotidyltransferase domain